MIMMSGLDPPHSLCAKAASRTDFADIRVCQLLHRFNAKLNEQAPDEDSTQEKETEAKEFTQTWFLGVECWYNLTAQIVTELHPPQTIEAVRRQLKPRVCDCRESVQDVGGYHQVQGVALGGKHQSLLPWLHQRWRRVPDQLPHLMGHL